MNTLMNIAKAVASEIEAGAGQEFPPVTVEMALVPRRKLTDLAEVTVTVVPKAVEITGAARSLRQYDFTVDLGIQQKLTGPDSELDQQIERVTLIVESIHNYLCKRSLAAAPYAVWLRSTNDPVYIPDHLINDRVLTCVLTVTYRGMQ